jgi:hypothetical protein
MLKLYETCFPNIWIPQPVPEYQVIKRPSTIYIRSQSKFFSPVEGPYEQEFSRFDSIQLATQSNRSGSPVERGKSASILSWGRGFLVAQNDIHSIDYGKFISMGNRITLKLQT